MSFVKTTKGDDSHQGVISFLKLKGISYLQFFDVLELLEPLFFPALLPELELLPALLALLMLFAFDSLFLLLMI